ncbi:MAG: DUF5719 family protein [Micropruina sp.]|uniref:DUF5719 family protein n=1 Tax=Micropruina sp. TaxID=2737536 RepID=UPI0039E3B47C
MKRLWAPVVAAAIVASMVCGGASLPVQQLAASAPVQDDRARVAVVCPTLPGDGQPDVIAAGSPQARLATAPLADPDQDSGVAGVLAVSPATASPLVVSAPRLDVFSASTRAAVVAGSDRGLSLASCDRPGTSAWFAGVTSSTSATADLVLLNADAADATVDLTVYGPLGRVNAPGSRGIVVPARSRRIVPLGPLFTLDQAVSVELSTSAGRVASMIRQRARANDKPAGSDWLPPTAAPATTVLIPGLPSGKGARELLVVNPGERTATVALQVLGAAGPIAVPGFETIELPPQTSRTVALGAALAAAPVGLRLSSDQKITAGVISGNGADADASDISTQVATPALAGPAALALSPGQRVAPVLHLTGDSAAVSTVRVQVAPASGAPLLDRVVDVPGFADVTLRLPRATDVLITIEPQSGAVHASVAVQTTIGKVTGVASAAVLPVAVASSLPPIRQDGRLGSG